ncbi:hypothetical protein N2152v2_006726 [Parachlorella kessleri]
MAPKSAGSYGQSSEASSANGSDASLGVIRGDEGGGDLLSRGNASWKESFFSYIYFMYEGRRLETDWRFFLLSTLYSWWRFYKRLLLSNAAVERGWGLYVGVLLVFLITGSICSIIAFWLNRYIKAHLKFRWKLPGQLLNVFGSIYRTFDISIFSLLTVSFTCNNDSGRTMFYFPDKVGPYLMRLSLVRILLPLVPAAFQLFPKWQAFFYFLLTSYHLYITIRRAPMHRTWLNCVNAFLALFPWLRFIWNVAERFQRWTPTTLRKETYQFWDEYEVEMVARVCRKTIKTDQLDVIPDPYYTSLAGKVVQAGLIQFPNSAFLNIVCASLQAVLLNDPSGGTTQLQKAKKCSDISWVQRFQVFAKQQEKLALKGRDTDLSVTLDAATWSEFSANYKAAIRSHKSALGTLKGFWHLLLRSDVTMVALVRQFLRIPESNDAAERSYKTLMDRYPNNPRVLRAYSRFLEQVRNDPHGASRFTALANKVELQQEEKFREVVFSQLIDRNYLDEKSTRTMAMIDETLDAVILINSEGLIQHINNPALQLFGYRKGELEGSNISALMPAPFSQQHDSAECFLGVIKQLDDNSKLATAYCTASGAIICINRGFSNLLAHQSASVVGRPIAELSSTPEKANQIIAAVVAGDGEPHDYGTLMFTHKFGEEISMDVVGRKAGTGNVTICVLGMSNAGNAYTGLITVNRATGRITYANISFCEFVGVPADQLIKMRLHEIMAEPHAMLHQRWIKGRDLSRAAGLKCRAGRAVQFKHGSTGKVVAALLEITERSTDQGNVFNVKVAPVVDPVDKEWNRTSLTVALDGTITSHTGKLALFGLEKEGLVSKGLDALLDVYRKDEAELADTHAKLLQDLHERPRTLRVAVSSRGKRTVPAVLEVMLPSEEDHQAPATMHLYRADCLEGVIELDAACKVKKVNSEAALLLGTPSSSLVGERIQTVLPKVCPSGRTTELLTVHGQRGGSKQRVGAPHLADGVHPDKHLLQVSLQAAESTERPGRYVVRIIVPKPISAYSTINRPGTTAPGVEGGSLRSFFTAGGTAIRQGAGEACPFTSGAGSASGTLSAAPHSATNPGMIALGSTLGKAAPAAPPSQAVTASGCPFGFGSETGGSREASFAAAVRSRPATGPSACPIILNPEEVLSSLSFPPASRFAIQKAHMEERARRASAQTDSTEAAAAALTSAAFAAAVQANDPPLLGPSGKDAGNDHATIQDDGQAADSSEGHTALRSMTASDEDGGGGGGDGEVDPAELAAKMDGVRAWLDATSALPQEEPGTEVRDAVGPRALRKLASFASSGYGRAAVPQEPAGHMAEAPVAAEGLAQPAQPGDRATVETSSMGGSDTGSQVNGVASMQGLRMAGDADMCAYLPRLRRFKKAYRLLNSVSARQAINKLRIHLRLVLLLLVGAHLAFFVTALVTVNSSLSYINNVDKAGTGARNAIDACTYLRAIQGASKEVQMFGHTVGFPPPQMLEGSAAAATTAAYDGTMLNMSVYLDVKPQPFSVVTQMTLWDSVQRLINSFKDVAAMTQEEWFNLDSSFSFRFAMENSPEGISEELIKVMDMETWLAVEKLNQLCTVTWILLGVEAGLVIPIGIIYLIRLLYQVAIERFNLFSIFFFIPRPAVMALARAEIMVDEFDDSDDDEAELVADPAGGTGPVTNIKNAKVSAQRATQSRLAISGRSLAWLLLPFGFWFAAVFVLWGLQHMWIASSVDRIASLDLSERVFFFGEELGATASFIYNNTDTAETLHYRAKLIETVTDAQGQYDLLLYGENSPYRNLDDSLDEAKSRYPGLQFKGTLFNSVPLNKLLYKKGCLRADQSTCYTKDSIYYWTTNMGLHTLTNYYLEQALWLAQTPPLAIKISNPALYYLNLANFNYVRALQGVVLAIALVGPLAFLYFMAGPYIQLTLLESRKVAEVLSYLPPSVDIASLLENANVNMGSNNPGSKGSGERTARESVDQEAGD